MRTTLSGLLIVSLAAFLFYGCEGPAGPAGAQGPPGPPGQPDTIATYLGDNSNNCAHCHDGIVTTWMTTQHSVAHDSLVSNPGYAEACDQCHSTGWDTNIENNGYDENHDPSLANVQCEACHGPMGPNPALHQPNLQGVLSGQACGQCHGQWAEYQTSAHGTAVEDEGGPQAFLAEWGGSSCNPCHTAEGFIAKYDPASYPSAPTFADGNVNGVSCGACHDAHKSTTGVDYQLRTVTADTLVYPANTVVSNYGEGQLCGKCHKDRRTETQMISYCANGNAHFGPHENPQLNMVKGIGSYQFDPTMTWAAAPNPHEGMLTNMCVNCHVKLGTGDPPSEYGHTFEPKTANCTCHSVDPVTFDHNNSLAEVADLMDSLETLIVEDSPLLNGDINRVNADSTGGNLVNRTASWAYFFVERDGTGGLHNPEYAKLILNNSITYYLANSTQSKGGNSWTSK